MTKQIEAQSERQETGQTERQTEEQAEEKAKDPGKSPSVPEIALSVFAAAIGVQNSENRKRDFSHGNPIVFIIAGLIFTTLFVLTIVGVVYLVL